jgi:hypothetical protein
MCFISGFVKPDHVFYTKFLEDRRILFWPVSVALALDISRRRKGEELAWHNPVDVPIHYLLVELILEVVKSIVIVPIKHHCPLKPF